MQVSQSVPPTQTTQVATPERASLTSDYELFLKMLTTQMTNQDPLNPVDSSDYAVQLATFSSVEQQVKTNELLSELTAGMGLADLGHWVGREIRSPAPAHFDGEPIVISTPSQIGASRAELVVYSANGSVVQKQPLDLSDDTTTWNGQLSSGGIAQPGQYTFAIRSFSGASDLGEVTAQTYGRITEAQKSAEGVLLVLKGGSSILPQDVTAIKE